MRKTVYLAAFLTIVLLGLSSASDLWAAPGQSDATVPTRTPTTGPGSIVPTDTPRPPSSTEAPRPNAPTNTPVPAPTATQPADSLPTATATRAAQATAAGPVNGQAPAGPITDTPQTVETPAVTVVPSATAEAVPSATAALTETSTAGPPAAAAGVTAQPTGDAGGAAPRATGPGPSPLLLVGAGLLVIGLVVAVAAGRRV
jgi:hypothetical protein